MGTVLFSEYKKRIKARAAAAKKAEKVRASPPPNCRTAEPPDLEKRY